MPLDHALAKWLLTLVLLSAAGFAGCGDDATGEEMRSSDGGVRSAGDGGKAGSGGSDNGGRDAARSGTGGSSGAGRSGGSGRGGQGGNSGNSGDSGNAGRGPTSGSGGSSRAGAGGSSAAVMCGSSVCDVPADGFSHACCADEATSTCGTSVIGGWCAKPSHGVLGCPALDIVGILMLPSCCTSKGMCGIDASSVGGGGCLDLATAADRARMAGASVVFPPPRTCDDSDAGAPDEDAGI